MFKLTLSIIFSDQSLLMCLAYTMMPYNGILMEVIVIFFPHDQSFFTINFSDSHLSFSDTE